MILFLAPGGRLGNLLFQVAYLESIRRPWERIFTINLFGVHRTFPGLRRYYNTDFRPATRFLDKFVTPWLGWFLEHSRLVTIHREHNGVLRLRRGILPVTFVEGYFQGPLGESVPFRLPDQALAAARGLLAVAGDRVPVFVHIRRGDYLNYTVRDGVRPLLEERFYRQGLQALTGVGQPLHYFFLGDSPDWCRAHFADVGPQTVSSLKPLEDLALMSLCAGGIVSNSTFAWWGGRLCRRTLPVIGPRFWLGWTVGTWIPETIETPWMTYLDMERNEK